MRRCFLVAALGAGLLVGSDVEWKIRRAAEEDSRILRTLHFLTDVHGPRLTGSPRLKAAGEWAARQLTEWGLVNARLEPWDFECPGWENERLSVHLVSPVKDALVVETLAWTPGTNGRLRARAVQIVPPERPTKEELEAYLESVRDRVKGRIVLTGAHVVLPVSMAPQAKRLDDSDVLAQYNPDNPNPPSVTNPPIPGPSPRVNVEARLSKFLASAGALGRVKNSGREHGQIQAHDNWPCDAAKAVPTVVMRMEDYGRIARILADGTAVELEVEIENRWYPEGKTAYNVIAEIPGSDKKDEVVMLGAHLDSWHSATGATDDAIGCAVVMEAVRILKTIGAQPRRSIRIALWSGEEQGMEGSKAYVQQHFGSFESPKPEAEGFVAYVNMDGGTGRPRGMDVFGPPAAGGVLREILKPFADLGVLGARESSERVVREVDSESFNAAGFAGISMTHDPIELVSHTWHTNLDTYERIIPEDARKSATVIAAAVYELANREERLPRFGKKDMPAPPKPRR